MEREELERRLREGWDDFNLTTEYGERSFNLILAEFDRLTAEGKALEDDVQYWHGQYANEMVKTGRLMEELEEAEYRRLNWQQTAEAHATCAESQGKKAAALQSWLDKIASAWQHESGFVKAELAIREYLDSQKPSEKQVCHYVEHGQIEEGHSGDKEDCPICNPKCEQPKNFADC